MLRSFFILLICFFILEKTTATNTSTFLDKGWAALVKDSDIAALKYFSLAYEKANFENDIENKATALLQMGICSYGVSYSRGLDYATRAMAEFKKLEPVQPQKALTGRSRCLQLISTINSRQRKFKEAIALSKEAMIGFKSGGDSTGMVGLIYNSLGTAYQQLNVADSAEFYFRKSLQEWLSTKNFVYLPTAYLSVAGLELNKNNKTVSHTFYQRAITIADSMSNRQAQVSSLLGMGNWYLIAEKNNAAAESFFIKAKNIAADLSDKTFYLKTINQLLDLKKTENNFKDALILEEEKTVVEDSLYAWDRLKAVKSLEIQFDVAEKDRQLSLLQKEKDIATLTNYMLWGSIAFLLLIAAGIILFLKRINKRDKQLLQTNEALLKATEEQKHWNEKQLQNEIEFKESQLSALTLQMFQKNELLQELKEKMEEDKTMAANNSVSKIINKGLNQDKDWSDFNTHFESINKNFYTRLTQAYPDISPNDLKICALIKLNLSIKEMAGILNISPDSVKTARYRLRKKLQLNTEDNLTDFILNLK